MQSNEIKSFKTLYDLYFVDEHDKEEVNAHLNTDKLIIGQISLNCLKVRPLKIKHCKF